MKPPFLQTLFLSLAGIVVGLAFVLPWLEVWNLPWPVMIYSANSVLAFVAYACDKRRATRSEPRLSEHSLHLLEVAGGFPGAFAAQRVLHHKNRKVPYQVVFWMIVLAHATLWTWKFFGAPSVNGN